MAGGADARRFAKTCAAAEQGRLEAEVDGLAALRATQMLRVPAVYGIVSAAAGQVTLELEYLELTALDRHGGALLGERLAALHRHTGENVEAPYGWPRDNFIGATPQSNQSHRHWAGFFAAERLRPQLALAGRNGMERTQREKGERVAEHLAAFFLDYRPAPCLLHGDLWSGNVGQLPDGTPVVFDPAVHRGDREADLAMAELFGGFPEAFYAAYRAAWPLDAGYETRKSIYHLYHVLNHFNLFGTAYLNPARRLIDKLSAALRG